MVTSCSQEKYMAQTFDRNPLLFHKYVKGKIEHFRLYKVYIYLNRRFARAYITFFFSGGVVGIGSNSKYGPAICRGNDTANKYI